MELRHLRYFVALAEELHFGRAAERLHIAQPALSQQIRRLEEELGVSLLQRTKRRVRLTAPGAAFLEPARSTLAHAHEAARAAQLASRGDTGSLVMGFVTSALYGVFPDIIRVFRERYRDVRLTLHELPIVQQMEWLRNGRIQVSFLRPPVDDHDLHVRTISKESWVVALPESHALAQRSRVPCGPFPKTSSSCFRGSWRPACTTSSWVCISRRDSARTSPWRRRCRRLSAWWQRAWEWRWCRLPCRICGARAWCIALCKARSPRSNWRWHGAATIFPRCWKGS